MRDQRVASQLSTKRLNQALSFLRPRARRARTRFDGWKVRFMAKSSKINKNGRR